MSDVYSAKSDGFRFAFVAWFYLVLAQLSDCYKIANVKILRRGIDRVNLKRRYSTHPIACDRLRVLGLLNVAGTDYCAKDQYSGA